MRLVFSEGECKIGFLVVECDTSIVKEVWARRRFTIRKVYNPDGATCAAFIREREEYYEIYSRQNTVLPPLG